MTTPNKTDRVLEGLERDGLAFRIGIGETARWFATIHRDAVIAERLAMLPDRPTVNVAVAAAVLNVPHSHVIAEIHTGTLAGHDTGRGVLVERAALIERINNFGLPGQTWK